ncbi:hypothetical protein BHM03_00014610 [Ensete ventricosum]|nr:hypothetical protein BHM03_00014610 [Ensete ventricosum]
MTSSRQKPHLKAPANERERENGKLSLRSRVAEGGPTESPTVGGDGGGVAEEEPWGRGRDRIRDPRAETALGGGAVRARSLTDDDLEEHKACLDLGFRVYLLRDPGALQDAASSRALLLLEPVVGD